MIWLTVSFICILGGGAFLILKYIYYVFIWRLIRNQNNTDQKPNLKIVESAFHIFEMSFLDKVCYTFRQKQTSIHVFLLHSDSNIFEAWKYKFYELFSFQCLYYNVPFICILGGGAFLILKYIYYVFIWRLIRKQHWIQYTEPRHANTNVNMCITQWIHYIAGGRHYVRVTVQPTQLISMSRCVNLGRHFWLPQD
jgi:membrane protein implicated in regulation of membrane protease activity